MDELRSTTADYASLCCEEGAVLQSSVLQDLTQWQHRRLGNNEGSGGGGHGDENENAVQPPQRNRSDGPSWQRHRPIAPPFNV